MAFGVRRAKRGIYQIASGVPTYIQEVWECKGLPDRESSAAQVIALCQLTNTDFPAEGSSYDGLPMRYMRVDEKATAGDQRRIIVAWGERSSSGLNAATKATRMVFLEDESRILQPYSVLVSPGPGIIGPPYLVGKTRVIPRGAFLIYQGQIVDSGFTVEGMALISANNYNKLYTINGQAAAHRGIDVNPLPSNQNFVWTRFYQNGWVKAVDTDGIEAGQQPIEALAPLDQYADPTASGTGRVAAADLYDTGEVLPWQT